MSWLDDGDDGLADICKACQSLPSWLAHENRPLAYLWHCKACAPCTLMSVGSNLWQELVDLAEVVASITPDLGLPSSGRIG